MAELKKRINSRTKGHSAEREICKLFKKNGIDVTRNLIQTRSGGCDLITEGTLLEPFAIEIKRIGKWSPAIRKMHWEQAQRQADKIGKIPILIWKIDFSTWMVEYKVEYQPGHKVIVIEYLESWLSHYIESHTQYNCTPILEKT